MVSAKKLPHFIVNVNDSYSLDRTMDGKCPDFQDHFLIRHTTIFTTIGISALAGLALSVPIYWGGIQGWDRDALVHFCESVPYDTGIFTRAVGIPSRDLVAAIESCALNWSAIVFFILIVAMPQAIIICPHLYLLVCVSYYFYSKLRRYGSNGTPV